MSRGSSVRSRATFVTPIRSDTPRRIRPMTALSAGSVSRFIRQGARSSYGHAPDMWLDVQARRVNGEGYADGPGTSVAPVGALGARAHVLRLVRTHHP